MAKIPRMTPEFPRMFRAEVVRTARVSPSPHRVTVTNILRSPPRDTVGRLIQEVPTAGDRGDLDGRPG